MSKSKEISDIKSSQKKKDRKYVASDKEWKNNSKAKIIKTTQAIEKTALSYDSFSATTLISSKKSA
jgi:hypothetical protein